MRVGRSAERADHLVGNVYRGGERADRLAGEYRPPRKR